MDNRIILQDDYNALSSSHYLWTRNRDRWEFYYNSYSGGDWYRDGNYLTKYQLETAQEYNQRIENTPLDNHCASVISTYISFLFRTPPDRDLGSIEQDPVVMEFLKDADLEGRSLDAFLKQAAIWASVFGHTFILMSKANAEVSTAAQQRDLGIRPYLNLITPLVASDWRWSRQPNGSYEMVYFKYVEEVIDKITTVKEWTKDTIRTTILDENVKQIRSSQEEENQLGRIPVIMLYNQRSIVRDLGLSDLQDISDLQRQIYNLTSEAEQSIRLEGHPTLVCEATAQLGSGAGAIIQIQSGADPGLNPYFLNTDRGTIDSIYKSIDKLVEAIDRISFTGGVRATRTQSQSAVSLEVEFALLNAKLAEKGDQLELCEEQIWRIFCLYQNLTWDGEIEYPNNFNIRDEYREMTQLQTAKSAATDPIVLKIIDGKILELLGEEEELLSYNDINPIPNRTYPDGEAIPQSLPPSYRLAGTESAPPQQNCSNCGYWNGPEGYCNKFDANVRPDWFCVSWEKKHDD